MIGPWWEQARFLELGVLSCLCGEAADFVSCGMVAGGTVTVPATSDGMSPIHIQHGIALGAPRLFGVHWDQQASAELREELGGFPSLPGDFAWDCL